jgi:hypothetical protein
MAKEIKTSLPPAYEKKGRVSSEAPPKPQAPKPALPSKPKS